MDVIVETKTSASWWYDSSKEHPTVVRASCEGRVKIKDKYVTNWQTLHTQTQYFKVTPVNNNNGNNNHACG